MLSEKVLNLKSSATMALSAKAKAMKAEGINVINLAVGEPDFDTPEFIQQAAYDAMQQGKTRYTAVDGTIQLKKAIQQKFLTDNQLSYSLTEIMASNGGKQIIFNALMATINPGNEVIIPRPYWTSYPDMVGLFEGKNIFINSDENFKISATDLEQAITHKTKWLILNSPSNPTGSVYTKKELEEIGKVLEKYPHVYVMSDDIYEHLIYDDEQFCNLPMVNYKLKERTLLVNGVSKAYAMTGWRLGYAAGPEFLIKAMSKIQSQSTSNASSISQAAAVSALSGDQNFLKEWRATFEQRRDMLLDKLNSINGLSCAKPTGAFYVFVKNDTKFDDATLCEKLLSEGKVAVVPGTAFGLEGYFRMSYALSASELEQACNNIKRVLS